MTHHYKEDIVHSFIKTFDSNLFKCKWCSQLHHCWLNKDDLT